MRQDSPKIFSKEGKMIKLILLIIVIGGAVVSIAGCIMSNYYAKKAERYRKEAEIYKQK